MFLSRSGRERHVWEKEKKKEVLSFSQLLSVALVLIRPLW